jgi:hypothetical protein
MSSSKTKKLQLAAEALAEAARLVSAASQEVDPVTQSVEALKCSFETELKALTKSIKASNENFDAKINSVNQKIGNLCLATEKTNTLLESQAKIKRLELAITCVHIGSFPYRKDRKNDLPVFNSSDEVRRILQHFVLGLGCDLEEVPGNHYVGDPISVKVKETLRGRVADLTQSERDEFRCMLDEMKVLFRKKIIQQIKDLVGQEPRLVDNGGRKFTILPPL